MSDIDIWLSWILDTGIEPDTSSLAFDSLIY